MYLLPSTILRSCSPTERKQLRSVQERLNLTKLAEDGQGIAVCLRLDGLFCHLGNAGVLDPSTSFHPSLRTVRDGRDGSNDFMYWAENRDG
jgi:hypothetical protein